MISEYICENSHQTSYPKIDIEARENNHTKRWEGYFLCKQCGSSLKFNVAETFSKP